jgi:hypothetical protein
MVSSATAEPADLTPELLLSPTLPANPKAVELDLMGRLLRSQVEQAKASVELSFLPERLNFLPARINEHAA